MASSFASSTLFISTALSFFFLLISRLDEWILKSTSEKAAVLSKIEEDLGGLSIQKAKAKENLENIIKGGDREISKSSLLSFS
jgi:hypothetical protein